MKLRQLPEDFKVCEIGLNQTIVDKGDYKVFLLRKKSLETFALINYLSKTNNILRKDFGIAGIKDKHAITEQYFTIPSKYDLKTLKGDGFEIKFLGFLNTKISTGDLKGNKFEITVRDVKLGELEGIFSKAKTISEIGVPNYFDSQRFGSVIDGNFIAKYLIKKDFETAVKIYLTKYPQFEINKIKQEKNLILKNWEQIVKKNPGISDLLNIQSHELKIVLKTYIQTGNWSQTFKSINPELREIMISAYQSHLWNECIRLLLRKFVNTKNLYSIDYSVGNLIYYKKLSSFELEKIPTTFMSISDKAVFSDLEYSIIKKILSKEDVSLKDFNIKESTTNFFKSHARNVLLIPKDFKISNQEMDELNSKHSKTKTFKIKLSFTLPKGSYATIITKRIFNH